MIDYDVEDGHEAAVRKQLVQFLESAGLYAPITLADVQTRYSQVPLPGSLRIQAPCLEKCDGAHRTFGLIHVCGREEVDLLAEVARRHGKAGEPQVNLPLGATSRLRFQCLYCHEAQLSYLVHIEPRADDGVTIQKVGEWPSARPTPPPELAKVLGRQLANMYSRGLAAEKFGFGIGAFAYYRHVTETIIVRLIEDLRRYAEDVGNASLVQAIDESASEQQASKRIEAVKDLLPHALRPPGHPNPLGTLYAALSNQLHSGTDEGSLELAISVRAALEFMFAVLSAHPAAKDNLAKALSSLQDRENKKTTKRSTSDDGADRTEKP